MKIEVTLTNKKSDFSFFLKPLQNSISKRWVIALKEAIETCDFRHTKRFYNFPGTKNKKEIANEINRCIDVVNNELGENTITCRATEDMPDEVTNYLHGFFEKHRGSVNSPGKLFQEGSNEIKEAIEDFNILIHRYEYLLKAPQIPMMNVTFLNRKRFDLEDKDYDFYTSSFQQGDVYLNYCEVGKPFHEAWAHKDEVCSDENLRPLKFYSADIGILFKDLEMLPDKEDFNNWMREKGYDPGDRYNALGYIKVARVKEERMSFDELIDEISKHQEVKSISVID